MKRLAAVLMVGGAALLAGNSVVDATYTPDPIEVDFSDTTPGPGEPFTVEVDGCVVGTEAAFDFQDQSETDTCDSFEALTGSVLGFLAAIDPATGSASATFIAPTEPGTYDGTVAMVTPDGPAVLTWSITVVGAAATTTVAPVGGLPATGGGSSSSMTMSIAAILLLAGAGMFGVAHMRRQQVLTS